MSFKPGQSVQCVINSVPRAHGPTMTIARLMRRDASIKKGLTRAQNLRRKRMHAYIRGGRMWYDREKAARIARVEAGKTWTMPWTPELEADLASVSQYVSVNAA